MGEINLDEILDNHRHHGRESLIPILQEIQDKVGFIPEDAIEEVGLMLKIPAAKIFGLATFYNQFRFGPKGKYHIVLCNGSACHMMGATTLLEQIEKDLKIKSGQTTRNGLFSLEVVPCMAACSEAPLMSINGAFYSKLTIASVKEIFESIRKSQ
jgi:NADH:ubiquinone oxidoreductase 24 kD subunit